MEIKGKIAVVTGGSSGIGRAVAKRLAHEGAAGVVLGDLDEAGGAETVRQIESAGSGALFVRTDVTKEPEARAMIEAAVSRFGRLDILFNNAGVGTGFPAFPAASLAQWKPVIEVDLIGVIMGTWLAAPIMEKQGGGAIVNTASMAGLYPHRQDPVYAAAKAGVINFTHSLAEWAAEKNIRVNCVCPGIVDTPMVRRGMEHMPAADVKLWAPSHMIPAEEIADVVATLLKDDSLFGCSLEVRPTGRQIVEPRRAPGSRRQ
jgi:NAD(P)-dependent dehydrogenase (short-subunit alcohol dehydrogenase family)